MIPFQLSGIECPHCGANQLEPDQVGEWVCAFCGTAFGRLTHLCPNCGHYHSEEVRYCAVCGTEIMRDCPACGHPNWVLVRFCTRCGRNLDLIDQIADRWQRTMRQWLEERQAVVATIRQQEERASQERMAVLLEEERRWKEALAQAQAVQQQRERQIYWLLGGLAILFLLFVLVMLWLGRG